MPKKLRKRKVARASKERPLELDSMKIDGVGWVVFAAEKPLTEKDATKVIAVYYAVSELLGPS